MAGEGVLGLLPAEAIAGREFNVHRARKLNKSQCDGVDVVSLLNGAAEVF